VNAVVVIGIADRQIFGELGVSAKVAGGGQLNGSFSGHWQSELRPSRRRQAHAASNRMSSAVRDNCLRRLECVVGKCAISRGMNQAVPDRSLGKPDRARFICPQSAQRQHHGVKKAPEKSGASKEGKNSELNADG